MTCLVVKLKTISCSFICSMFCIEQLEKLNMRGLCVQMTKCALIVTLIASQCWLFYIDLQNWLVINT